MHGCLALSIILFKKIYRQMKSTNFNMYPTPSKTLSDHPRKRRCGKLGPFLSFGTKCRSRATYDLNVEAIFFAIGRGRSWFDILNLDIIDRGSSYCYNLTVSALFRVSLLFAWRRLCQGQGTCTQSETLVHINWSIVTKKW